MIILKICQKQPFDINLGLCCVHIAQLMTHPAVYPLPFTLQFLQVSGHTAEGN